MSASNDRLAGGNVIRSSPTSKEVASAPHLDLSVLVVDDDRSLREGCVTYFQVEGYNVTSVGSGQEAIDLVGRRKFDLVMLDLYMTQVSGMDILAAILAANRDTLVVVMTGNPSVATNLEAL